MNKLKGIKSICRHCHFLSKELRDRSSGAVLVFSLSSQEREKAAAAPNEVIADCYSLNCRMGVWDEGVSGSKDDRNTLINLTSRESRCFFFPYNSAMLFDAARELQKRADEHAQMKKSNFYTQIGLWIAAAALFIDALTNLLSSS